MGFAPRRPAKPFHASRAMGARHARNTRGFDGRTNRSAVTSASYTNAAGGRGTCFSGGSGAICATFQGASNVSIYFGGIGIADEW